MTKLDAKNMPAKELCARIRESTDTALAVEHVNGQRYIAAGLGKKELTRFIQDNFSGRTVKQADAHSIFQFTDRSGDCRLGG